MADVLIVHPNLPGRVLAVGEQSVPHYEASGWQLKPADDPANTETPPGDEDNRTTTTETE